VTGLDDGPMLGDDHGSGRLANLSVRTVAGTGEDSLITGFVATGTPATATKTLLVRGIGPALGALWGDRRGGGPRAAPGRTGRRPRWRAMTIGVATAEGATLGLQVGAFALANSQSLDAALVARVVPGPYTVQVSPTQGAAGVALAEVYDGTPAAEVPTSGVRLINLSVRARAGTGEAVLIAGFVIADGPRRVLVRGIGPALSAFGVGDALADPVLELFRDQARIDGNDNWGGSGLISQAATRVGAFALPAGSRDAALVVLLPPGAYSVQLRGVGSSTGVALVEVYEIR
jgi:hypothetical protein